MGGIDAIVFNGGIGENMPAIRTCICQNLESFGFIIDERKNEMSISSPREIQSVRSCIKILLVPTDEEKEIAHQTIKFIN